MLKTASAAVLSVIVLASASQASAQVASPTGSFTLAGTGTISQTFATTCVFRFNITMNPGGLTGQVTSASFVPGHVSCVLYTPASLPWTVDYVGPGSLRITGFGANTPAGYCNNGVLNVAWNNTPPGSATINAAGPIPGATTTPPVPYPTATCNLMTSLAIVTGGPVTVL